jgi:hypothetical protein
MDRIRKRLLWIGVAIFGTLGAGTLGFVVIDDFPLFDAFYMTGTGKFIR